MRIIYITYFPIHVLYFTIKELLKENFKNLIGMLIINIKSREICLERDTLEWTTALKSGEKGLNTVLKCKLKKKKKRRLYKIFSFSNPITSLTMQAPSSDSLGVFSSLFPVPFNYFSFFSSSSSSTLPTFFWFPVFVLSQLLLLFTQISPSTRRLYLSFI